MREPEALDRRPTLADVLSRALESRVEEIHTWLPAQVVRYDASTQQVDVQILIKSAYLDEEDNRQTESVPVICCVPVIFPGAGKFRLTFPISDGTLIIPNVNGGSKIPATIGKLSFAERSLDKWLSGNGAEVDPEIDHGHALADATFHPGLNPFGAPLADCPTDHCTIGVDGGVQIHFHGDVISVGDEAGNDFIALAQKVLSELNSIKTVFDGHTHIAGVLTSPSGAVTGSSGAPANPMPAPSSVAAAQGKAK